MSSFNKNYVKKVILSSRIIAGPARYALLEELGIEVEKDESPY